MESLANLQQNVDTSIPAPGEEKASLPEGFARIYAEHSRGVYYLALRILGNPTMAEDATHDIFLKIYQKLDQFRGRSSFRTWIYRITINHCKNVQQTWHQRKMINNVDDAIWEQSEGHLDDPLRVLETKELGQRIQRTLDALPEEYRLLLLLIADEKLSYEQIAELTEQNVDAVRGKLYRARKAFHSEFNKKES